MSVLCNKSFRMWLFLRRFAGFLLSIVSKSLVGACNFLSDLTCVLSFKKPTYVGLFIMDSLIWLNFCEKVEVKSKMCEGELEVCVPLFSSIA